jgi:predicted Holliday junction resolvase-like endonuclease
MMGEKNEKLYYMAKAIEYAPKMCTFFGTVLEGILFLGIAKKKKMLYIINATEINYGQEKK